MGAVIWTSGNLKRVLRLNPKQTGGITRAAAAPGVKYLMISAMLHMLEIAFCRLGGRNSEIYVIDKDGSEVALTRNRARNFHPAWPPDGTKIAYSSGKTGRKGSIQSTIRDDNEEIYVIDADGKNMRRLT